MRKNAALQRPVVGVGALVLRGGKVLLGKRLGAHGEGFYAPPGGHIEGGESIAEAARREVMEECGLEITDIRLVSVGSYRWGQDSYYVDVDIVCSACSGEPLNLEPDRCAGWDWYDLNNPPTPLFIVAERIIACYKAGVIAPDIETIYHQPYRYGDDD